VAATAKLLCQPEIEANGLGMADMKIPVRFRRKTGNDHPVLAACQVIVDDRTQKITGWGGGFSRHETSQK
jgi:hypothetical protein